mgnify:CR=1
MKQVHIALYYHHMSPKLIPLIRGLMDTYFFVDEWGPNFYSPIIDNI